MAVHLGACNGSLAYIGEGGLSGLVIGAFAVNVDCENLG